uniref:Capsid protein n=1 Tax=Biomphalaria pfeifferi virus TaxID=2884323 RepID=A0A8K1P8C2_9VIRU|nr:MAG: hypothetical protein [Biomphalaria pfeifferi virus]
MPESINAHLAVMRSAFSTACAAAKVPDGRVSASIASREAGCSVILQKGSETMCFALIPCINSGMAYYTITSTGTPPTDTVAAADIFTYDEANKGGTGAERCDRFRVVSAAMRLSSINSAQYNNGWFEAIRVQTDYIDADVDASAINNKTNFGTLNIAFENNLMKSTRWCSHPSYVTGKLADLYKHQFYLQSQSDREFNRTAGANVSANYLGFDVNMDTVLVRVYAGSNVGTGSVKAAIHCHVVHHIEMNYDASSEKARYHSQCMSAPQLVAKVDASIKKDSKASIIRSPNSYGVNTY